MVAQTNLSQISADILPPQPIDLKWTSITIQEVVKNDYRLEASVYGVERRKASEDLDRCSWEVVHLGMFIEDAYYGSRSKRSYIDRGLKDAVGFCGSSEMLAVYPKPSKFVNKHDGLPFSVKKGQILLSRSGTIGNVTLVNSTLEKFFISEHAIRIICKEYPGYIYCFLKSKIGRILVESNTFGAVISQIEPDHLNRTPIPNPPPFLKSAIHNLVDESFRLRDESNDLMDKAQTLLKGALQFTDIEKLKTGQGVSNNETDFFSVPLSKLGNRLDASFHVPIVEAIEGHLEKVAKEVTKVGDSRISSSVILPGRFKRIYVEEGSGVVFFGGKQIWELDPSNKKYLSINQHGERIKDQLALRENMILITCSGTIGKVTIVPEQWDGWTANQHVIRIVPTKTEIAGYIYTWLSSDYAYPLINRHTYGAVIDEIDDKQVLEISIPLLRDEHTQLEINDLVLRANRKRSDAYYLEQKALSVFNEKVIHA